MKSTTGHHTGGLRGSRALLNGSQGRRGRGQGQVVVGRRRIEISQDDVDIRETERGGRS